MPTCRARLGVRDDRHRERPDAPRRGARAGPGAASGRADLRPIPRRPRGGRDQDREPGAGRGWARGGAALLRRRRPGRAGRERLLPLREPQQALPGARRQAPGGPGDCPAPGRGRGRHRGELPPGGDGRARPRLRRPRGPQSAPDLLRDLRLRRRRPLRRPPGPGQYHPGLRRADDRHRLRGRRADPRRHPDRRSPDRAARRVRRRGRPPGARAHRARPAGGDLAAGEHAGHDGLPGGARAEWRRRAAPAGNHHPINAPTAPSARATGT